MTDANTFPKKASPSDEHNYLLLIMQMANVECA